MNFKKALKISQRNMKREPWLTATSILVITLTLLMLNLFSFTLLGSHVILKYLENKAQVSVFFEDTVSEQQILEHKAKIESDQRVLEVNYISKVQALEIFTDMNKEDPILLESVASNPLPASLEIKAKQLVDLQQLSEEFTKIEGVEDVKFYRDVVDSFRSWSDKMKIFGVAFLLILSFVSVVVVLVTIGITIHTKGLEVEILKLVGASDNYVKTPLIVQGITYGIIAAFVSVVCVYLILPLFTPLINSLVTDMDNLGGLGIWTYLWSIMFSPDNPLINRSIAQLGLMFIELLFGMLLGYIGSALAIRKYLKY